MPSSSITEYSGHGVFHCEGQQIGEGTYYLSQETEIIEGLPGLKNIYGRITGKIDLFWLVGKKFTIQMEDGRCCDCFLADSTSDDIKIIGASGIYHAGTSQ